MRLLRPLVPLTLGLLVAGCSQRDRDRGGAAAVGSSAQPVVQAPPAVAPAAPATLASPEAPAEIVVETEPAHLVVRYAPQGEWRLVAAQLAIALDPTQLPQTSSGIPKVSVFPVQKTYPEGSAGEELRFPLDVLAADLGADRLTPGSQLYLAAHAVLERTRPDESRERTVVWAGDRPFPGSAQATFFPYTIPSATAAPLEAAPAAKASAATGGSEPTEPETPSTPTEPDAPRAQRVPMRDAQTREAIARLEREPKARPEREPNVRPEREPKVRPERDPPSTPQNDPPRNTPPSPNPTPSPTPMPGGGGGGGNGGGGGGSSNATPPPPSLASVNGINAGDFRSQTMGGWGTAAVGSNPGAYRDANFAAAFPNGLVVGDPLGLRATFSSSAAVEAFLPAGGTSAPFSQDHTDPVTTEAGNLAGQVVALTLSVGFDAADPAFSASATLLRDLVVADPNSPCANMTVQQVLDEANRVLAGLQSALTPAQIADCVAKINENFVDGVYLGPFLKP